MGGWGMSSKWPVVTIDEIKAEGKGSIAIGPFGSRMKSDCYVDIGVAVIRGTNLGKGPEFVNGFVYVTKDKANELVSCNVFRGDLVFPHRGAIGEVGIVADDARYVLSSSLMKLTCDTEKALPKYVYYFFKSARGRHELLKNASQVGTPGIGQPLSSLKAVEIPLPPLYIQKKIAGVLGELDSKIYLNTQINQTLEQIAQAIFKSWFVDFEPVKAKIAARQRWHALQPVAEPASPVCYADDEVSLPDLETYMNLAAMQAISGKGEEQLAQMQVEQPDEYAELLATAELFPSAMQESEFGEVPEGWCVGVLQDLIEFNPRRSLKRGVISSYLDMQNVPTSGHLAQEVVDREMTSGTKFINGDTLLARITPCLENGKTAYVDFLKSGEVGWGSTEYIVMRPREIYPEAIGYFIARDPGFRQHAIQSMTGTSGRQRANAKALADLPWIVYPPELAQAFGKLARSYLEFAKSNGDQSKSLSEMRDALLPRLLSGELFVPGIESQALDAKEAANV